MDTRLLQALAERLRDPAADIDRTELTVAVDYALALVADRVARDARLAALPREGWVSGAEARALLSACPTEGDCIVGYRMREGRDPIVTICGEELRGEDADETATPGEAAMRLAAERMARTIVHAESATIIRETYTLAEERDEMIRGARRSVIVLVPRGDRFAAIRSVKHGLAVEFPGGKVEPGESGLDAARREGREELGVAVFVHPEPLGVFLHVFEGTAWSCEAFVGVLSGEEPCGSTEGAAVWATREELLGGTHGRVVRRVLAAYDRRSRGGTP